MKLYVIRNKEGKFFRSIGYGGGGMNWQDKLENAKFYAKAGTAKGQITFWFKEYPQYGCPELLEFDLDVANATVFNMQAETEKKILKASQAAQRRRDKYEAWRKAEPRPH